MKLTHNTKRAKGMTLLELTVVILVLLSLISILFVGAQAWKRGSDRAASILKIRNTQQAVRSFSNMNGHSPGDKVAGTTTGDTTTGDLPSELFGEGKFMDSNPTAQDAEHPAGGDYKFAYVTDANTIPELSKLYINTSGGNEPEYFNPDNTSGW